MSPGDGTPQRRGPVARLFGSLADALLDLGLPTIRQWLRDRAGPGARVAEIKSDGSLIVLKGVRVPIGGVGVLALDRAAAAVVALGRAGGPSVRLHAFEGVVMLGPEEGGGFRAEVSFEASPEPNEAAWISGELEIVHVSWRRPDGSAAAGSMRGRARLFVSSRQWRVEEALIEGDVVRARFVGAGSFEQADETTTAAPPLVRGISSGALALERAKLGSVLEAASAIVGRELRMPEAVPLEGVLSGELSWSVAEGARADLRLADRTMNVSGRASFGPRGEDLRGRVGGDLHPASALRGAGVSPAVLPRPEDSLTLDLALFGELRRPEVKGTIVARELGFRFGRPRFVPPVVVRDVICDVFLEGGRLALRGAMLARASDARFDVDIELRDPPLARGHLRADHLDAGFLRELVATFGANVAVPRDASGAMDLALVPGDGAATITGAVTLTTSASRVTLTIAPRAWHAEGTLALGDLASLGVLGGAVIPVEGAADFSLDLDPSELRAEGRARAGRIVLGVRGHEVRYVLEDVSAELSIDRTAFRYSGLRFRAHGGRFVAHGAIPLAEGAAAQGPLLELSLEEGGAELAEALAALARRPIRAARDGEHPPGELWLPRELGARGTLRLEADASLIADVELVTPAGSSLSLSLRATREDGYAGSALSGTLALDDASRSGVFGAAAPYVPWGLLEVDALVSKRTSRAAVLAFVRADRLGFPALGAELAFSNVVAALRIDAEQIAWNGVELGFCGGQISTSGVHHRDATLARVEMSDVAVHELPELAGRSLSAFVRGRLRGSFLGRWHAGALRASGPLALEDAALPAIDLVRPALASYGLRPPNEDASSPVTARLLAADGDLSLREVSLALRGATVRGEVRVSRERTLDGYAEVTLEEDYLRTSKRLTLPRVLAERLVVPVRIDGAFDRPRVQADLGGTLGRFLKDNRVRTLLTSAAQEAQALLGRRATPAPPPSSEPAVVGDPELASALRDALAAHAADWDVIERHARR